MSSGGDAGVPTASPRRPQAGVPTRESPRRPHAGVPTASHAGVPAAGAQCSLTLLFGIRDSAGCVAGGKSGGATRGSSAHTRTGAHEKTCGMRGSLVPGASSSLSLSAFRTVTIPPRVPPFRVLAGRGRIGMCDAGTSTRRRRVVAVRDSPNSMWRPPPGAKRRKTLTFSRNTVYAKKSKKNAHRGRRYFVNVLPRDSGAPAAVAPIVCNPPRARTTGGVHAP